MLYFGNMNQHNKKIIINYTNRKGESSDRVILPLEIWYGETKKYKDQQWFLKAINIDTGDERNFPLKGINSFSKRQVADETSDAPEVKKFGNKKVKLYTDGGSRGNPGPSAIGFAVFDESDNLLFKESKYLGITTNNQAEYQGLKQGLEACKKHGFRELDVYMDSLLVINQMKGIFKVKNRDLWPIYESTKEFISHFSKISFTHIPRELNKVADSMVNECLDNQID